MPDNQQLDVFLLTYNCAKVGINPDVFVDKLVPKFPETLASLYVFGVEEYCSVLDGTSKDVANRHFLKLNQVLLKALVSKYGDTDTHFHTLVISHVGAVGIVAITPFPSRFSHIRTAKAARGYFYSSMKGSAAFRLAYSPTGRFLSEDDSVDLTFANSHLCANEGEYYYLKRNEDTLGIMRALDFGDGYGFLKPNSHGFFMGDLNYRTTKNLKTNQEIASQLRALHDQTGQEDNDIEDLVFKYDELSQGIRNDEIFMGFTEPCIKFPPTYKYHVGTAIYNNKRSPSWCDRILYQSTYETADNFKRPQSKSLPEIQAYDRIEGILTSDHQPVYLSITIPFHAPKSIVSKSGYLQILPNDQVIDHFHRKSRDQLFNDTASGPTQIYIKPTKLDSLVQMFVSPAADDILGKALWIGTTTGGRVWLVILLLILSVLYVYLV